MKTENVCEDGHGKYNHRPSEHSDRLEWRDPARQGRCKLVHGHSRFLRQRTSTIWNVPKPSS